MTKPTGFKAIQETTKWTCGFHVKNNIYLIKAGKLFGYIREDESNRPIYMKVPMFFEQKGRTFKTVSLSLFDMNKVTS